MIKLDRLNDKQKEAVLADDNKILLVSAAGSGKTRVLTTKVAYLISEKGVSPSNILALTFTNKAAGEMKERVLNLVGDIDKQDINIMTFHSFGVKALRKFINRYDDNFNQNFIILDANDTKKLFQKVMKEANDYLCDNGIIAPSDLPDDKEWEGYLEIRNDYLTRESKDYIDDIEQEYCERFNLFLEKNNSMTFDDLLIRTYLMFKNYPVSLQYYQTLFQYILVDEFQDTDDLQFEILTMLQEKNQRLFAVGDDWQAIYSFRKANPEIMLSFDKTFKDTHKIFMEQNYRSTPEIVELGNAIISYNKCQLKKDVFTENPSGDKPELICVARYQDEARYITYKIQELIRSGYNYSDIAILYRTNSLSRGFEDALLKARIPYRVHNGTGFYSREEIKDMLSFLSLIGNDYDNIAFERIINKPKRKIGAKTIDNLTQSAIENSESNHYSLLKEIPNYKGSGKDKFQVFYDQIIEIRQKYLNKEIKLSGIIKLILEKLDYTSYLDSLQTSEDNDRLGNVYEFATILKEYENQMNLESAEYTLEFINEIVQNITLFTTDIYDEETGEKNVVTLMTMHASKGLEYPIVFLPALEKGIFPNPRGDEEEERRLFYVACTRAEKKIFASYSIERYINGQLNYTTMSPYVNEVLEYFKQK